ncbi:MAG: class I SAM-dependent methyltransferase [bacterium]|nr:class I SAM-dependent methyltransferase [bacterium]
MNSEKVYETIGKIPSLYDDIVFVTGYKKSIEYFVSQLPFSVDQPIRVLDAGCGTGFYIFAILQRFPHATVVGFDTGEKLIQHLRAKLEEEKLTQRARVFVANIQSPLTEIQHETFDLVITAGVLEYVPLKKTIQNLARFLVLEGYFLNASIRKNIWGTIVCKFYICTPYGAAQNTSVFEENGFVLHKVLDVPSIIAASFRDPRIFKKIVV